MLKDKDKYLIEKYILLKVIKNNPKSRRSWLRKRLSKLGYSLYDQLFTIIFIELQKDGLVSLDLTSKSTYASVVSITDKGTKTIIELEAKIKFILTINR